MFEKKFVFLINCLHFNDINTQVNWQCKDKFAPIHDIWGRFIKKCTDCYMPAESLTVDKQLFAFCEGCVLKQYIANKPAKYEIKIVMITMPQQNIV